MYKLLILADDFTGALDTGVQFAKKGISTIVTTNDEWDFSRYIEDTQVLVIDLETRHLEPQEAYNKVYSIATKCIQYGIQHIYKKTDSGLRGNIGSELVALVDAFKESNLIFVPAFPKTQRTTVEGIHYIAKKRITKTEVGKDPFSPVKYDSVQKIIKEQSDVMTISVKVDEVDHYNYLEGNGNVYIIDSEREEDLQKISTTLKDLGTINLLAGCAGFAEYLPQLINLSSNYNQSFHLEQKMLFVSGSVNDITRRQIQYARDKGYNIIRLSPAEKLSSNLKSLTSLKLKIKDIKDIYTSSGRVIVDGGGDNEMIEATRELAREIAIDDKDIRETIKVNIGKAINYLYKEGIKGTYIVIGGDTLKSVIDNMGFDTLVPITEIESGITLSKILGGEDTLYIVSKSGGFGEIDALIRIGDYIKEHSEEIKVT
ncbi:four-carbon acid sugar kinase family protein [Salinibacillus xinjiangensis]|uniref:Four-carbon acid sugar kinase family protein n=1 Tax=Salinibacillus xinjiangensis TaxID=1229268 RepID=A0A6G1X2G7_9BACI|nr:four-carbon acid sugar kinase family protein [Salinibacillus xinjiangensis]MRG85018.1 hypothetical protein [Salinibacillus xinjiangensis]